MRSEPGPWFGPRLLVVTDFCTIWEMDRVGLEGGFRRKNGQQTAGCHQSTNTTTHQSGGGIRLLEGRAWSLVQLSSFSGNGFLYTMAGVGWGGVREDGWIHPPKESPPRLTPEQSSTQAHRDRPKEKNELNAGKRKHFSDFRLLVYPRLHARLQARTCGKTETARQSARGLGLTEERAWALTWSFFFEGR